MSRASNSIYLKMLLAGILAIVPAGSLILYNDYQRLNRLMDQQLSEHFLQMGSHFLSDLELPNDLNEPFDAESKRILSKFNAASGAARMIQSSLYKRVEGDVVYRLAQNVQLDKVSATALLSTNVFKSEDFLKLRRIDPVRYTFAVPMPSARSPEYVLLLQAMDKNRPAYLQSAVIRNGLFWGLTFIAILLFVAFVVHSEVKIPMKHLRTAFTQKRKAALDPDDFGEFADLVQALEEYRHSHDSGAADQFLDPDTGFPTEVAAQKIFDDARLARDENYVVFFKVNYAADYVKLFGRANRSLVKKITAESLEAGLPKNAPRAVTEEYFFISGLGPKEFKLAVERCQHHFNEAILRLYELGQGKQIPIQTLSAFAISNHSSGIESFSGALEIVQTRWTDAIDPHRGGWAVLDEDGRMECSKAEGQAAAAPKASHIETTTKGDVIGLKPAPEKSPVTASSEQMDPGLARKMFIVKLCRLSGIKPRLAAQVYSAGWQRPDLLLQTKIQELSERAGLEAQEASDLIANLRKFPKEKLAYESDDYKEVFFTDVRMIRKISRDSLSRWYDAGFRRVEDLRAASMDDLIRLDETVPKEDIESLLSGVRGTGAK